ncbi:MAG: hypothetical protein D6734_11025 [Candidatus Schekmanbacteria bacterium]|nr:MAG: hypothetical protein D6734_11025 [Candidatus Schekmanbacteria bacterium]
MIIKVKNKADFDRLSAEWGLVHFKETENTFELYVFKFGVGYLYVVDKSEVDVDAFRDMLVSVGVGGIEIEEIRFSEVKDAIAETEGRGSEEPIHK